MILGIDASRANEGERTGTEWYSYHLIQQFKKLATGGNHQVVLYSQEPLRDGLEDLPDGWSSQILPWKPGLLWTHIRFSAHLARKKPDVLFVPANTIPISHPKTIVTIHDVAFESRPELYGHKMIGEGTRPLVAKTLNTAVKFASGGKYTTSEVDYHRWSTRHCVKEAAHIITPSEYTKTDLRELFGVTNDRMTVVPNGFNAPRKWSEEHIRAAREKIQLEDTPYILFIGRIERKKNVRRLIEAFSIIADQFPHHLVLAGNPGEGYDDIIATIDNAGLQNRVHLLGWTDTDTYQQLLGGADLFVLPSLYEGFGIPVLEAFSAGTPVACSRVASLPEVAGDAAFYFNPEDTKEMSKVLLRGLRDDILREDKRYLGFERAAEYSWERCAKETWEVLNTYLK